MSPRLQVSGRLPELALFLNGCRVSTAQSHGDRSALLAKLHTECVSCVLGSLIECYLGLLALPSELQSSAEPSTAMQYRLLVSCLRALTQALRTAVKAGSAAASFDFSTMSVALFNAAFSVGTLLLPRIPIPVSAATTRSSPEVKVWRHALAYVASVAAFKQSE